VFQNHHNTPINKLERKEGREGGREGKKEKERKRKRKKERRVIGKCVLDLGEKRRENTHIR
jgi:hypothetical protein